MFDANTKVLIVDDMSTMRRLVKKACIGFPAALPAHKIPLPSQLLAFADWFEYLMRPQEGQPKLSPLEATEKIQASAGLSVELIVKIRKFFSDMGREQATSSEEKR